MEGIINIAGVMPRIGTTTIALQLMHFLKRMGYEPAYVERNAEDYIWGIQSMYTGTSSDKKTGKTVCNGLDLYPDSSYASLTAGGTRYDYLICDFGNIRSRDFDINKFAKCSAMILVAGVKANEVHQTEDAIRAAEFDRAIYVFNYIRKEDERDILDMMGDKAGVTCFAPWMPDPVESAGESADECFMSVMNNVVELSG